MFAIEAPGALEVSPNSQLYNGTHDLQIRSEAIGMTDVKQDKNSNFVVELYNKNENFGQLQSDGTTFRNSPKLINEPNLQMKKEKGSSFTVVGSLSLESGRTRPPSAERVRIPPEGAEVGHPSKLTKVRDCEEFAVSPSDDNGYSSSCLSIESPDSVEGSIWETSETIKRDKLDPWQQITEAEVESIPGTPPAADSFLPSVFEAVQSLQEKQRFKEQEKEKHQTQVVMYRRLALLRWIRSLKQKVVDHQNRLQESYDTILSNRKELLKFIKQGVI
ncbi:UPF0500 protein C1orf216 homolog [Pristis pectinata]|uniref:UPF0500 protein C1orf216 homolog n=1 Tax=Pristis pectinata TaxID=685728 RepID=UPI00223D248C|nr:UPF0500 protein C1orf216 homolog [Pristis pectinata]